MKRIKGDARGELAEGRYWSPGMGHAGPGPYAGEGWSDRDHKMEDGSTTATHVHDIGDAARGLPKGYRIGSGSGGWR